MTVFVDTSAFIAVLDRDDKNHSRARSAWERLIADRHPLVTTNYILVECMALLQNRFGIDAVRTLTDDILPLVHVEWIDEPVHGRATGAMLSAGRRKLSLVDCASFDVMRSMNLETAFAFDRHYKEAGFKLFV